MGHDYDKVVSGQLCPGDISKVREAICIQTEKVYDQCKEKDCVEDARVYFPYSPWSQTVVNNAINVKVKSAEVVDVFSDVQPVPFKRGFFTVDIKFFIKVEFNFFVPRPPCGTYIIPMSGLILFDKKVILFGSEGGVKVFKSTDDDIDYCNGDRNASGNDPIAKIEVADPVGLTAKLVEVRNTRSSEEDDEEDSGFIHGGFPQALVEKLGNELIEEHCKKCGLSDERFGSRRKMVLASVGLFSIVKLVRNVQVLIPAFDFCVPNKTCIASTDDDPCQLFETIDFPVDEFFPPQMADFPGAAEAEAKMNF